jgi:hypothetical protein
MVRRRCGCSDSKTARSQLCRFFVCCACTTCPNHLISSALMRPGCIYVVMPSFCPHVSCCSSPAPLSAPRSLPVGAAGSSLGREEQSRAEPSQAKRQTRQPAQAHGQQSREKARWERVSTGEASALLWTTVVGLSAAGPSGLLTWRPPEPRCTRPCSRAHCSGSVGKRAQSHTRAICHAGETVRLLGPMG